MAMNTQGRPTGVGVGSSHPNRQSPDCGSAIQTWHEAVMAID